MGNWKELKHELSQQKLRHDLAVKQMNELSQDLLAVRNDLLASLEHSEKSETEIARLRDLLAQSTTTLADLRTTFDEYVKSSNQAIRRAWITGAVVGILVGAVLAELVRWVLTLIFG